MVSLNISKLSQLKIKDRLGISTLNRDIEDPYQSSIGKTILVPDLLNYYPIQEVYSPPHDTGNETICSLLKKA